MGELPYKLPGKKKEKVENNDSEKVENVGKVSRSYTQEEVDNILQKREEAASASNSNNGGDEGFGISASMLKQLQTTVGVFNAFKEFASNPLSRSIETKIGERASVIIDQAFGAPQHSGERKDALDLLLNSQLAFGFGQGLGARGPEMVETLGRTFGKEKVDRVFDNIVGHYGKGGGSGTVGIGGGGNGAGGGGISGVGTPGDGTKGGSQRELLMTLDPNNPEHVAAYADSQGGISLDLARRMLRAHQDDFIKQMKEQGLDVSGFEGKSGDDVLKLKQEQEEMLRMKREVDRQLNELDKNRDKVVSFKDIKSAGASAGAGVGTGNGTEEVLDKVVEIPDKWSGDDLTEAEKESVANAERDRFLANIKNSTGGGISTGEIKAVDTVIIPIIPKEDAVDYEIKECIVAPEEINFQEPEKDIKEEKKETKSKFAKGTQGWLKEQKEKKAAKGDV